MRLTSKDKLTQLIVSRRITTWGELLTYIQHLSYGRNSNRYELELVIEEEKGSCSSKHALLKKVADLNKIPNIHLIMGIYKMNAGNTSKIGVELIKNQLEYIPEAHCYLRLENKRVDLTSPQADFKNIEKDILEEKEIQPEDVAELKVHLHRTYLKNWMKINKVKYSFEELWKIRENCIALLSEN